MVFGVVYVVTTARNRENMTMIEAGMNPRDSKENKHSRLRFAMLVLTVPIGILIGSLTHSFFNLDYGPAGVVFGGIGLMANYFIEEAKKNNFDLLNIGSSGF